MAPRHARRELERIAAEIVPLLIDRLADSNLAEVEVRDGDTRVRVRRAPRSARAASEGRRQTREREAPGRIGTPSGNGATGPTSVGPGRPSEPGAAAGAAQEPRRIVARSPAVGYFLPRERLATGEMVGLDDVLGHVDVLGVRQDVVSPASGIVSRLVAEPGQAVEYGEELLHIDLVPRR